MTSNLQTIQKHTLLLNNQLQQKIANVSHLKAILSLRIQKGKGTYVQDNLYVGLITCTSLIV